jgi:hypothetical protein
MRIMIIIAISILILFVLFSIARRLFSQATPINVKILISMMFFGGVGFAFGQHFSSGWAVFGAGFGVLIGIEYKDNLFKFLHLLYRDIVEDDT